jgi:hypothetical protein
MQSSSFDPPVRLLAQFNQHFPDSAHDLIVQAPGRELWIAAALTSTRRCALRAAELDARTAFTLQSAKVHQTYLRRPLPRWARYAAGVWLALEDTDLSGLNAALCGNEPAGPRYEYAVGLAFAALLHELSGRPYSAPRLIELIDRVHRDYVEG